MKNKKNNKPKSDKTGDHSDAKSVHDTLACNVKFLEDAHTGLMQKNAEFEYRLALLHNTEYNITFP